MTDIVAADWVAERLEDLVVIDVRDAWEYEGIGHLPGAVNVPFDEFRASEHASERSESQPADPDGSTDQSDAIPQNGAIPQSGMLPDVDAFESLLRAAGLSAGQDVVVYDDHHGVFAARLLVTLELYGHDPEQLHLLDGDFTAWQGDHETTDAVPDPPAGDWSVRAPATNPLVDADAVAAAADDPDAVVVDTRTDEEYETGHVEGAVALDWRALVDQESRRVLGREAALDVLDERGIVPEKRVVLYCNTARRISHTYVVLRHLGFADVAFYEGSLTEWRAMDRPLVEGPSPTGE